MLTLAALMLMQVVAPLPGPAAPAGDRALYADCVRAANEGVPGAIDAATRWLNASGGVPARHCLGLAYMGANRPADAARAFEDAARVAESKGDASAAELYGQAGNALLLAGQYARAEVVLNNALVLAAQQGKAKGELLIDRARAREAQGNSTGARADLEQAVTLAPNDAAGWLLLGALARREERLDDARPAIANALRLAPNDPDVQLEAGNMAAMDGDYAKARALWNAAVRAGRDTPAGKAADAALLRNPE
ncbi:tetratricopeptide repeat protein [Sphingosinicella microcystinivorans]|uniref:tetratricopeptide repeat protein n=1 Tax=Sphingosinicella microcystinivorans TaxID=335406 RepID=UPI0022F3B6A8|nr:tetratricopeptide repeat protein [Sphingosinicella microcystinivorans]WBX84796.1 tetratricopeptide repeat protein [Sphingosinicella microcystinivorans]